MPNQRKSVSFVDLRAALRHDEQTARDEGFSLVAGRARAIIDWMEHIDGTERIEQVVIEISYKGNTPRPNPGEYSASAFD